MPSLSALLKRSKTLKASARNTQTSNATDGHTQESNGVGGMNDGKNATKRQSRASGFFRGIMGKMKEDEHKFKVALRAQPTVGQT